MSRSQKFGGGESKHSVYVWQFFCKFFIFDTQILAQDKNARQLTRTICQLTCHVTSKEKNHKSIDTLEKTRITRQLKYSKLQLKYTENITHNNRRTSYTHLHT